MTRFLRHLLVLLAVTGLSLQPVAAAFAPPCAHQASSAAAAHMDGASVADAHDCHGMADDAGAPANAGGQTDACSQCGICHLACGGALPASAISAFARPAELPSAVLLSSTFHSHVGDLLLPPPRRR